MRLASSTSCLAVWAAITGLVALICLGAVPHGASAASLLWNPGPKYHSYITFTKTFDPASDFGCLAGLSTFSQAHTVGNPSGVVTSPIECEDNTPVAIAANGAHVSVYRTAMVGWSSADHEQYPGWAVWNLSGGGGTPIVAQFINHAKYASSPCTIREVGYSYQNWADLAHSHFKSNGSNERVTLGDYDEVIGEVTAKRSYSSGPPSCSALSTGVIHVDFRVAYENGSGQVVRSDVIGVVIDVMPGTVDMNGVNDEIFYRTVDGSSTILYADRIGLEELSDSEWTEYSIDFKALLDEYIDPPNGYTIDDAIIGGYDVYSSVRGGDLDFIAKDLDVRGE